MDTIEEIWNLLDRIMGYKYIQEAERLDTVVSRLTDKLDSKGYEDINVIKGSSSFDVHFSYKDNRYEAGFSQINGEWSLSALKEERGKND